MDAFYTHDDGRFTPSLLCRGPWSPDAQHGGPPAGLLARAVEQHGPDAADFRLARLTVDLLRPIPLRPMELALRPVREGRKAGWYDVELRADGALVARATALRVRRRAEPLSAEALAGGLPPGPPPPGPAGLPDFVFPFFDWSPAFHTAVELREVGQSWPHSPVTAWARPAVALVAGEPWTAGARVACLCDALNGVSPAVPFGDLAFPNADLTVALRRAPVGEWLGLRARSQPDPGGGGLAQATLYDEAGELGLAAEDLVLG
jgi:hypothetical protein